MRVLVLGFDGFTPELAFGWAREGLLPHLGYLMGLGAWGSLRSVVHPITPAAWTSMITGTNPGRHGIYDFGARCTDSYRLRLTTSLDNRVPDMFEILSRNGKTVGSVNIPLSFPPRPVRGLMVTGMHTPRLELGCYPEALAGEIRRVVPEYMIDAMSYNYDDRQRFLEHAYGMLEARAELAHHLWSNYPLDLLFVVFVAADRIQHALWRESFPGGKPSSDGEGEGEVYKVYRALDDVLGSFVYDLRDDDVLFVVSDHGFGPLYKDVFIDRYLEAAGLLRFVQRSDSRPMRSAHGIDWHRTLAYSHGMFGNVYINLAGREPEGVVQPGREYARVVDRTARALEKCLDPEDGLPLVDHVLHKDDLYSGQASDAAPDLVVIMRDYACMARGGRELHGNAFVSAPLVAHTGNHRLDGCLAVAGAGVRPGLSLPCSSIMDVFPTVMSLLGTRPDVVPDGRPLFEAFEDDFLVELETVAPR